MKSLADDSFESELFNALRKCGLSDHEPKNKHELLQKIQNAFIIGNPRAWWTHLRPKPLVRNYEDDDGYLHLGEFAPPSTNYVWFVVDEDNEKKYLFDIPITSIPNVVKDCRYFEYYIISKDLSWLLAENDHGSLLFVNRNI